jgi:hypothetical protein
VFKTIDDEMGPIAGLVAVRATAPPVRARAAADRGRGRTRACPS